MACSARIWRYTECVDLRFRQVKAEPHGLALKPGKVTAGSPAHGLTRAVRLHGHALAGSEASFSDHLDGQLAAVGLRVEEEMPPGESDRRRGDGASPLERYEAVASQHRQSGAAACIHIAPGVVRRNA